MRPLIRPILSSQLRDSAPALGLLLNRFGPYCAFSEEPVFDVAAAWNRTANVVTGAAEAPGDAWDSMLLVSPATAAAWQHGRGDIPQDVMAPDVDVTFRLTDSPFTYELEMVKVTWIDDNGEPIGEPESRPLAIVHGANDRARATIDLFALNSEYFDADRGELAMPRSAYLSREDNRLFLRTETWARAVQAAEWIAEVNADARPALVDNVRVIVAGTGFWSVWATVLWRRFQDRDLVARALMEPSAAVERFATLRAASEVPLPEHPGPGPHNAFPGTRPDWLI